MENKQEFNKLSEKRRKELKTMFPSDKGVYLFKLLNGSTVPTIDKEGSSTGRKTFYPRTFIKPVQTVFDEDGTRKTVAALKSYVGNDPRFHQIMTDPARNGFFSYRESVPEEAEIIDFLLCSNDFASNPYRSKHEEPLYDIVDNVKVAKHKYKIAHDKALAYRLLDSWNETQVKDFAAAMGWDDTDEDVVLRGKVYDMIENPSGNGASEFKSMAEDPELEYRSLLKRAMDKNIVTFSPQEYTLTIPSTGTVIPLDRVYNKNEYDMFVAWLEKGDNMKVGQAIKSMVYPKPEKASKGGKIDLSKKADEDKEKEEE